MSRDIPTGSRDIPTNSRDIPTKYSPNLRRKNKKFVFIANSSLFYVCINLEFKMAQNTNEYGKIVSATDGENLFGAVITSYQLNTNDLLAYCQKAGRVIMFAEENAELFVAGAGRIILSLNTKAPSPDLVFHVYTVTKVNELITLGKDQITVVEIRNNVVDLKNGEFILEFSEPCPPNCY
ncbi:MAG: hypothetical protein Q8N83_07750 [Ignavibacteria bacterium]|nr:hypothetical protein [Ignavibacteria bacterium]